MIGGRYRVIGSREYRGHAPGSVFDAVLPASIEARAVRRGSVELVERVTPTLEQGSYELPSGWLDDPTTGSAIGSHERG